MPKKAFTLVELIVVITILAVLATVAFISFQGYALSARDSTRLADLNSITKVLELYNVKHGKYPNPDAQTNITYSGSTAWTQGVFGISSYSDGSSMSNVPVDPVTGLEYPYSVTSSRGEYSLAAVLENPVSSKLSQSTFAGTQEAQVHVKGNYNGKFLKVRTNTSTYLLGVPSILASDITSAELETILTNERLVYKGYKNLPASYSGSVYNTNPTDGFPFGTGSYVANDLVLFMGDTNDLEIDSTKRVDFLDKLQTSYSGSLIESESYIAELLSVDSSSSSAASNYVATALNNSLKMNIAVVDIIRSSSEPTIYPSGCDQDDITIGSYTIASCNAGTSVTGTGTDSYGGLYQWGNNFDFRGDMFFAHSLLGINGVYPITTTSLIGVTTIDSNYIGENEYVMTSSEPHDWTSIQNDNLWGNTTNTNIARQGPCVEGYHVPQRNEWIDVYVLGGWTNGGLDMSNELKLPFAGYRNRSDSIFGFMLGRGMYWSSSPQAERIYALNILNDNSTTVTTNNNRRANAFSVRCFKN